MSLLLATIDRAAADDGSRLRALFEHAPGFVAAMYGPTHILDLANAAFRRLAAERPLLGQPIREAFPDFEGQGWFEILDRVYATGEPFLVTGAFVSFQRDPLQPRQQRRLNFMFQPLVNAGGDVEGIFCEGQDATDHWLTDGALRETEAALASALQDNRDILNYSLDVICTIDGDGRFITVSKRCEELWGYTAEELQGRRYIDHVHPDDRDVTNTIAAAIMSGTPTKAFQNRYLRHDGSVVSILWSAVWSDEHQRMFATAKDLTERLDVEERLRQSQRMEAVGQLTGGVAHDFNNLLTVVVSGAESMLETLPREAPERELAELALQAGERGGALVTRLLGFARQQPLAPELVDVGAMAASMEPLVRRGVGSDVEVQTLTGAEPVHCVVDRVQLESALLNLCLNARDAMQGGGSLRIEIGAQTLNAGSGDIDCDAGEYVSISVSDDGEGMTSEARARAFEPFFTTKAATKGSGLGLSTVYGFIKQSGGCTRIASELGVGTSVTMFLPRAAAPGGDAPTLEAASIDRSPALADILVVEDDDMVRSQVGRLLASLSHRVISCRNAAEALVVLSTNATISLLFTDVVMPGGMSGSQLAERARVLRPGLPVLFTSGHTEDTFIQSGRASGALYFLAKPYRKAELARKVEDALRGSVATPLDIGAPSPCRAGA